MLPIEPHLPAIVAQVTNTPVTLLEATPGSGKTTLVPLALMRVLKGLVLVLEPRRIAARWAAQHVAQLLGEPVGQQVGYQYRFEKKVGEATRLVFLTEGTFLNYLQTNPTLEGVAAVVLDEFHERHLATDMAFGLLRALSARWKHVPRLLIMSATLNEEVLKRHFPAMQKINITAPVFPLEIKWAPNDVEWSKRPLERKVLWGIQEAFQHPGDMLVFMPGLGEIKRLQTLLTERLADFPARVLLLHGQESSPEHELMRPLPERKIILASNVAESSVTIPGVRIVIDAGLYREAVYSAWSGQNQLITSPCSKASAIQRAGRAARSAPGMCWRLYTESEFHSRPAFTTPELLKTDLAEVVLQLAHWQLAPEDFPWPEAPEPKNILHARELLTQLGALEDGLTPIGKKMQQLPLPVRAARVWVEAQTHGTPEAFRETCRTLAHWLERGSEAKKLEERLRKGQAQGQETHAEKFWMSGFAERIAKGRSQDVVSVAGETFKLAPETRDVWDPRRNFWLVLDVNPLTHAATKLLPLEDEWVTPLAHESVETFYDETRRTMIRRVSRKLGALTLEVQDSPVQGPAGGRVPLEKAARAWLEAFHQSAKKARWQLFQAHLFPARPLEEFEWELFLQEFLLEERLPTAEVEREFAHKLDEELQLYLDASFQQRLTSACPTHYPLHDKKSVEIHYELGRPPWIESYIQDFFGREHHPSLMAGRQPLTLQLWGPHGRALQVTADLAGFWQRHYPTLKKELSRDYPRHFWPDDPQKAVPQLRLPRKT